MKHKYTFKKVREYLIGEGLLRFNKTAEKKLLREIEEGLTIHQFITNCFEGDYLEYGFPTTYSVNTGKENCGPGRDRSLGDVYKIVKHYYPEAKLNEVHKAILSLVNEGVLGSIVCPDIHKRVYGIDWADGVNIKFGTPLIDEFGFNYEAMKDKAFAAHKKFDCSFFYSDEDDLKMINIK